MATIIFLKLSAGTKKNYNIPINTKLAVKLNRTFGVSDYLSNALTLSFNNLKDERTGKNSITWFRVQGKQFLKPQKPWHLRICIPLLWSKQYLSNLHINKPMHFDSELTNQATGVVANNAVRMFK
jgi:hypothetical protein